MPLSYQAELVSAVGFLLSLSRLSVFKHVCHTKLVLSPAVAPVPSLA